MSRQSGSGGRSVPSISELRARANRIQSASALRRLAAELAADRRRGARALAERCRRRALRGEREERRIMRLFELRDRLASGGARQIAGVDEVGVGPLAGPVVAAAVVLPRTCELPGLDDSKKLTPAHRARLDAAIRDFNRGKWDVAPPSPQVVNGLIDTAIGFRQWDALAELVTFLSKEPQGGGFPAWQLSSLAHVRSALGKPMVAFDPRLDVNAPRGAAHLEMRAPLEFAKRQLTQPGCRDWFAYCGRGTDRVRTDDWRRTRPAAESDFAAGTSRVAVIRCRCPGEQPSWRRGQTAAVKLEWPRPAVANTGSRRDSLSRFVDRSVVGFD